MVESSLKKYLRTRFYQETSPLAYLRQLAMTQSGIWASDVEIVNVVKMFSTDVFVATKLHSLALVEKNIMVTLLWLRINEVTWYLY